MMIFMHSKRKDKHTETLRKDNVRNFCSAVLAGKGDSSSRDGVRESLWLETVDSDECEGMETGIGVV